MIMTNIEVPKAELAELHEEAYQEALEKAFEAEYKKVYVVFRDRGYSAEDAESYARDEARSRAGEFLEDYLVEPGQ